MPCVSRCLLPQTSFFGEFRFSRRRYCVLFVCNSHAAATSLASPLCLLTCRQLLPSLPLLSPSGDVSSISFGDESHAVSAKLTQLTSSALFTWRKGSGQSIQFLKRTTRFCLWWGKALKSWRKRAAVCWQDEAEQTDNRNVSRLFELEHPQKWERSWNS